MSYNLPPPGGKQQLEDATKLIRAALTMLKPTDDLYLILNRALEKLNQGKWLNEEQLKALYKMGWREGEWLSWRDDDFE